MANKRKAQAAIEYLMVFGTALLLSTPFVIKAQQSVVDIQTGSELLEARNTLNQMESAAQTVNAAGEPARRTFTVRIPDSVERTEIDNNYIQMGVNTSQSYVGLSRTFEFNVTGNIPQRGGNYLVSASAVDGAVDFEVVG
ncbi:hypothetical protein [Candidatus Nanohalococcus occultus]|uniref:Uncharacterized protein n=1 Tax=Candidatus Nanohalococcus occultus TaxID=2978047 RepID=A0ABY8CH80_9ARCH|nr:hypothetical protein SVXNc_0255 [Candidatus Nanohaloarchaeota archaeon SVXNc]